MKQNLQITQKQQFIMSPQLQQAIRLLQLSTLELQQEIQLAIDTNPMLEFKEELSNAEAYVSAEEFTLMAEQELDLEKFSDIPSELVVDSEWDEIYNNNSPSASLEKDDVVSQSAAVRSLKDHLNWQLSLSYFSDLDVTIATVIIDAINEDGFLTLSLEEIRDSIGHSQILDLDEIAAVLKRVQCFDPVGVGARDLKECLLIQLGQLPEKTPFMEEANFLIKEHLMLVARHDLRELHKASKLPDAQLTGALTLIQRLCPKPGTLFTTQTPHEYVTPDLLVFARDGHWQVVFNPDAFAMPSINMGYQHCLQQSSISADQSFLQRYLQQARWLIKSVHNRNETLLRVGQSIISKQRDFLEYGPVAMRPLKLKEVADELGLHESTVSRITRQKFVHLPQGVFELKYFFSNQVGADLADNCSSVAIREVIKKHIEQEETHQPLSDSKLVLLLKKEGLQVARRTVAKYRELMAIPPSHERRCVGVAKKKLL